MVSTVYHLEEIGTWGGVVYTPTGVDHCPRGYEINLEHRNKREIKQRLKAEREYRGVKNITAFMRKCDPAPLILCKYKHLGAQ